MIDQSHIGFELPETAADVEAGQLKFFAKAVGEKNPVYFDEDAARAAGHPALPAPPTFLFSLGLLAPSKVSFLDVIGVDIGRVLHGEQQFSYRKQIYAGDRITMKSKVTDIYAKKGGALEFVVQETVATNQHGETVGTSRSVTVVRNV